MHFYQPHAFYDREEALSALAEFKSEDVDYPIMQALASIDGIEVYNAGVEEEIAEVNVTCSGDVAYRVIRELSNNILRRIHTSDTLSTERYVFIVDWIGDDDDAGMDFDELIPSIRLRYTAVDESEDALEMRKILTDEINALVIKHGDKCPH